MLALVVVTIVLATLAAVEPTAWGLRMIFEHDLADLALYLRVLALGNAVLSALFVSVGACKVSGGWCLVRLLADAA